MRFALIATLALSACGADSVHLAHHSTLVNATRGLVLLGDGVGHGAMLDTTCVFDGTDGFVTADIDLPTSTERITGYDPSSDVVVGISAAGVHPIQYGQRWADQEIRLEGVIDAQPVDREVVWLRRDAQGACFLGESTPGAGPEAERSVGPCSPDARLFASAPWGLLAVHDGDTLTEYGQSPFTGDQPIPANQVAFDPGAGALWVAVGGTVTRYGSAPATFDIGVDVGSLASLGARGGFVVVGSSGDLAIFDDEGVALSRSKLPGPAAVVVSQDGRDLSLVTDSEAHNYTIEDGPPRLAQIDPPELFQD